MWHDTQAALPKTGGWSAPTPWLLVAEMASCLTFATALTVAIFLGLLAAIRDAWCDRLLSLTGEHARDKSPSCRDGKTHRTF